MENIITQSVSIDAKTLTGRLTGYDPDAVMVSLVVGGAGFLEADLLEILVTMTLKNGLGENKIIADQIPYTDLLKLTDFKSGFSKQAKINTGTLTGKWVGYLPLGNIIINGDDALEVSIYFPGDATYTADVRVTAVDLYSRHESISAYESVIGSGQEVHVKNCEAVFLCTDSTGANISVKDQEGQVVNSDHDIIFAGMAFGRMEIKDPFGIVWADRTGFSQDVYIKVPADARLLIQKKYFPLERLVRKADNIIQRTDAFIEEMKNANPEKYDYLRASGELG